MQPGEVLWRSMAWKLRHPWRWRDVSAGCLPWSFFHQKPKGWAAEKWWRRWEDWPSQVKATDGIHVLLDWPDENEYMCMWSISNVVPTTSCWRLIGLQSPLQAVHNERVQPGRSQLYSWPKVVLSQLHRLAGGKSWEIIFRHKQNGRFQADPLEFSRQIFFTTNGKPGDTRTDWDMWNPIQELREELQSERPLGSPEDVFDNQFPSLGRGYLPGHQKERKSDGFPIFIMLCQRWVLHKLRGSFRVVNFTSRLAEVSIWQKQSEVGGNRKSCGNLRNLGIQK